MEKPRILFISPQPFFQWRGSPIRVKFNLLALGELGYSVDLLTLPVGTDVALPGVRVFRVANPFKVKQVPIGPSLWKLFFDGFLFVKAVRLCFKHRYAVIHGIEEAGFLAAVLAWLFRTRAIFEKHSDPFSYKAGPLKNLVLLMYAGVERASVRMSNAVIGTGSGLVAQVEAMKTRTPAFDIPDIPSSVVDAGADDVAAVRASLLSAPDDVLITYVGSFAVYQGVDLLFEAIPATLQRTPKARFVVIGGTEQDIAARRAVLENLGVATRVTFLGKVDPDALPAYLSASDILLSPRISGINTPLKVLDYMKAGRAIAATDVPANRLLLDETLAMFAAPNPEAFATMLAGLITNPSLRTQLGSAAHTRYQERYTFALHRNRLAACYQHVLA